MKRTKRSGARATARRSQAAKPHRSKVSKAALRSQSTPSGEGAEIARLARELKDALDQQAATSNVLDVISNSPGDLELVFKSMLENAVRICDAQFGNIYRWDGEALRTLASHNTPSAFAEARDRISIRPGPKNAIRRMIATKEIVLVADMASSEAYAEGEPITVAAVDIGRVCVC
jgi:hypothetical protein